MNRLTVQTMFHHDGFIVDGFIIKLKEKASCSGYAFVNFCKILQCSQYVLDIGDIHSKAVLSPLHQELLKHQVLMSTLFEEI